MSRQSHRKKAPQWKSGAIVIAWIFMGIVAVTLVVAVASHFIWGKFGPLHLAACEGDVAECERLAKSGVPVDVADVAGHTPLDWAIFQRKPAAVQKLIELGADVNHVDALGMTPLMYTATALKGRLPPETQAERNAIARMLIDHGANVNQTTGTGRTTLHFAAADRNAGLVRMLLAAGANRNARTNQGYTPLDVARFPDYAPNEEVIRVLERR